MKVVERIFEHRIRQQVDIDNMQFGFMKGKRTIDAIFGRPYYRSSLWYSVSSVCLSSVTFCIVAKRCVLAKKCLKE